MLEVHQRDTIGNYSYKLKELSIDEEKAKILEAYDNGNVTGYLIFSFEKDYINIYWVDAGLDIDLADGLIRTALFKAMMTGIDKAEFKNNIDIAKTLNFIKDDSTIVHSVQKIMDNCGNCKKIC